jgi:hypothetical protein
LEGGRGIFAGFLLK